MEEIKREHDDSDWRSVECVEVRLVPDDPASPPVGKLQVDDLARHAAALVFTSDTYLNCSVDGPTKRQNE
jgi:hypothetical protein